MNSRIEVQNIKFQNYNNKSRGGGSKAYVPEYKLILILEKSSNLGHYGLIYNISMFLVFFFEVLVLNIFQNHIYKT